MDKKKLISILEKKDKNSLEEFIITGEPEFDFLFKEGLHFFAATHLPSKNPVNVNAIIDHFLSYADVYGAKKTVEDIEKYLNTDKLCGIIVLAICGIYPDEPISINENITLIPYQNIPDSYYKAVFDPYSVESNFSLPEFPKEFLAMKENPLTKGFDKTRVKPTAALIYSFSGPRLHPIENLQQIYSDLKNTCLCLTLIGPSAPTPMAMWGQFDRWVNCWPTSQGSVYTEEFDLINTNNMLLKSSETKEKIATVCHAFLSLSSKQQEKLYIPLTRLNNALIRKDFRNKVIELGIAIESIIINDSDEKGELTYKIQLRAAKLLGANASYAERKEIQLLFKKLYNYRSTIVHGRSFNKKDNYVIDFHKGVSKTAQAIEIILLKSKDVTDWNSFWSEAMLA